VPIDLSGLWAIFLTEVPASTQIRLDAEHDRFEWVPEAEGLARCKPASVAASVAAAAFRTAPEAGPAARSAQQERPKRSFALDRLHMLGPGS
jgi:hypothetical protein